MLNGQTSQIYSNISNKKHLKQTCFANICILATQKNKILINIECLIIFSNIILLARILYWIT